MTTETRVSLMGIYIIMMLAVCLLLLDMDIMPMLGFGLWWSCYKIVT